jgi:hypothetical protein
MLVVSNVILFVLLLSPVRPHHEKYSLRRSDNWIFPKNPVVAPSKKRNPWCVRTEASYGTAPNSKVQNERKRCLQKSKVI